MSDDSNPLAKAATAAYYALRSYQYGNSSTELAKEAADALFAALTAAGYGIVR